jgi:hypothetical protein
MNGIRRPDNETADRADRSFVHYLFYVRNMFLSLSQTKIGLHVFGLGRPGRHEHPLDANTHDEQARLSRKSSNLSMVID